MNSHTQDSIIRDFVSKVAPSMRADTTSTARHTINTLSQFLCVTPDEVVELCNAKLLVASEPWPGAPSLRFSNLHLYELRRRIAECHAADAVALAGECGTVELHRIVEMSWRKRQDNIIELSYTRRRTEFGDRN